MSQELDGSVILTSQQASEQEVAGEVMETRANLGVGDGVGAKPTGLDGDDPQVARNGEGLLQARQEEPVDGGDPASVLGADGEASIDDGAVRDASAGDERRSSLRLKKDPKKNENDDVNKSSPTSVATGKRKASSKGITAAAAAADVDEDEDEDEESSDQNANGGNKRNRENVIALNNNNNDDDDEDLLVVNKCLSLAGIQGSFAMIPNSLITPLTNYLAAKSNTSLLYGQVMLKGYYSSRCFYLRVKTRDEKPALLPVRALIGCAANFTATASRDVSDLAHSAGQSKQSGAMAALMIASALFIPLENRNQIKFGFGNENKSQDAPGLDGAFNYVRELLVSFAKENPSVSVVHVLPVDRFYFPFVGDKIVAYKKAADVTKLFSDATPPEKSLGQESSLATTNRSSLSKRNLDKRDKAANNANNNDNYDNNDKVVVASSSPPPKKKSKKDTAVMPAVATTTGLQGSASSKYDAPNGKQPLKSALSGGGGGGGGGRSSPGRSSSAGPAVVSFSTTAADAGTSAILPAGTSAILPPEEAVARDVDGASDVKKDNVSYMTSFLYNALSKTMQWTLVSKSARRDIGLLNTNKRVVNWLIVDRLFTSLVLTKPEDYTIVRHALDSSGSLPTREWFVRSVLVEPRNDVRTSTSTSTSSTSSAMPGVQQQTTTAVLFDGFKTVRVEPMNDRLQILRPETDVSVMRCRLLPNCGYSDDQMEALAKQLFIVLNNKRYQVYANTPWMYEPDFTFFEDDLYLIHGGSAILVGRNVVLVKSVVGFDNDSFRSDATWCAEQYITSGRGVCTLTPVLAVKEVAFDCVAGAQSWVNESQFYDTAPVVALWPPKENGEVDFLREAPVVVPSTKMYPPLFDHCVDRDKKLKRPEPDKIALAGTGAVIKVLQKTAVVPPLLGYPLEFFNMETVDKVLNGYIAQNHQFMHSLVKRLKVNPEDNFPDKVALGVSNATLFRPNGFRLGHCINSKTFGSWMSSKANVTKEYVTQNPNWVKNEGGAPVAKFRDLITETTVQTETWFPHFEYVHNDDETTVHPFDVMYFPAAKLPAAQSWPADGGGVVVLRAGEELISYHIPLAQPSTKVKDAESVLADIRLPDKMGLFALFGDQTPANAGLKLWVNSHNVSFPHGHACHGILEKMMMSLRTMKGMDKFASGTSTKPEKVKRNLERVERNLEREVDGPAPPLMFAHLHAGQQTTDVGDCNLINNPIFHGSVLSYEDVEAVLFFHQPSSTRVRVDDSWYLSQVLGLVDTPELGLFTSVYVEENDILATFGPLRKVATNMAGHEVVEMTTQDSLRLIPLAQPVGGGVQHFTYGDCVAHFANCVSQEQDKPNAGIKFLNLKEEGGKQAITVIAVIFATMDMDPHTEILLANYL